MSTMRWGMFLFCAAFAALLCAAGCSDDEPAAKDGPPKVDGGGTVAEDTAERCQDGKDNDGDGLTDCADQNCWSFAFCADAGAADAGVDAPAPDGPEADGPEADGPAADGPAADGPAPDGPAPDGPAPDTLAPDTLAPDTLAPDTLAPDTLAPDTLAPDTLAPDTLAPDLASDAALADALAPDVANCGDGICGLGETCAAQFTNDAGAALLVCPADCDGVTTGGPSGRYCCVEGVCIGEACATVNPDCTNAP